MCGRYTLTVGDPGSLGLRFGATPPGLEGLQRYNVAPTEPVLVVSGEGASEGKRRAHVVRWGLVPRHARELGRGTQPINARAETAATRPMFARLAADARHRCLVLADGWFEWLRAEDRSRPRQPFHHTLDGGAPFAFAGLWDETRMGDGRVASCTILTVAPNDLCARIHDRMPAVLAGPDEEAAWLSGDLDADAALGLCTAVDAGRMAVVPVDPAVNRSGIPEGPELLAPFSPPEPAEEPATLF